MNVEEVLVAVGSIILNTHVTGSVMLTIIGYVLEILFLGFTNLSIVMAGLGRLCGIV